jgi:hypothetical protein
MLARPQVLTRQDVPARLRPWILTRQPVRIGRAVRPGARAVADPDRAGAQHAPQLAGARQVGPVTRAEREVLGLAREIAAQMAGPGRRARRVRGPGEAVVWIGPRGGLARIEPGVGELAGELRELVTAPLADGRKRDRVPGQAQRDLERLPGAIAARHCSHSQH